MKVMIAVLVGFITLSFAGVASAGSRCDSGEISPPRERGPHSVSNTLQKAHDSAMSIIQNMN